MAGRIMQAAVANPVIMAVTARVAAAAAAAAAAAVAVAAAVAAAAAASAAAAAAAVAAARPPLEMSWPRHQSQNLRELAWMGRRPS